MKREIKITFFWMIVVACLILFIGFAGNNDLVRIPNAQGHIAGFGKGIVHGFLVVIGMVVSIFNNKCIYEVIIQELDTTLVLLLVLFY